MTGRPDRPPAGPGDSRALARARRRIAVLIGAAILVGVLLASAVTYVSVTRASIADSRRALATVAATADRESVHEPPPGVWLVVRTPHGRVFRSPRTPALPVQDLLAHAPRTGAVVREVHLGGRDFLTRVQRREERVVLAVKDLSPHWNERRRLAWGLGLASLLGLLLAIVVGYLLAGRATRPLVDAMARQRRFVADASHELRTPLSRVVLRAEILREELPTSSRSRLGDEVGSLLQDARGMAELLNDLLLSAQLGTGSRPADLVDVGSLVREAVGLDQVRAGRAHVTLTADVRDSTSGLHAWGSPPALRRAVGALVDNAIAHTPPGGTVAVHAGAQQRTVRVDVVDDGEGFDVAHLPELLRPFSRGHEDPRRFGLGLALVKDVLEAHRGTLTAQSRPGHGTRWTIELPLAGAAGSDDRRVRRPVPG